MSLIPLPHHRLLIDAHLGALHLHADATFHAPWTVLFGPSGSGKSTLLRAMAGLLAASANARNEFQRLEPGGHWRTLPDNAQQRDIAYAPQAASLFPHLTVAGNVSFGPSVAAHPRSSAPPTPELPIPGSPNIPLAEARDLFELAPLWQRRPAELSGGEAQRVNLARAFARPGTRLLLLDEPFTGLDRPLRDRILPRLRAILADRQMPVISVTHDIEEAFLLGADILRLEAGRVLAHGPATMVLAAERQDLLRTLA